MMEILGNSCQVGGLPIGQRLMLEKHANPCAFEQGPRYKLIGKRKLHGVDVVDLEPDHGPSTPFAQITIEYGAMVKPVVNG